MFFHNNYLLFCILTKNIVIISEKKRKKIKDVPKVHPLKLLILALSSCLRLLLTLYAGLLVALSLAKLGKYTGLNALSFKTTKCAIKSFVFFYSDFCHLYFPPFAVQRDKISNFYLYIIM